MENFINQLLFWLHVILVASFPVIGWMVGPLLMVAIVALHRAHILVLGECAFSKLQRHLGGLPHGMHFLQQVSQRIFNRNWSARQCQLADCAIVTFALAVSCFRF